MTKVRFIGLDVLADTIVVAVAEPSGAVRSLGMIPNRPESIRKLVKKLGAAESLRSATRRGRQADGSGGALRGDGADAGAECG
jgi:hypothetical protein